MAKEKQSDENSALKNILNAGAKGAASPSLGAKIVGEISPPGAGEAAAQGLQATANMGVAFSKEFMTGIVRQHGKSPSAVLQDLMIQKAINAQKPETRSNQSSTNKGIESARQKTTAKKNGLNASTSAGNGKSNGKGQER